MKDSEAEQAEVYLDKLLEDFQEAWELSDKTMADVLEQQRFKYEIKSKAEK